MSSPMSLTSPKSCSPRPPSGQRPPPEPSSPAGGSVRGFANGSANLPHFCYPVPSPYPFRPNAPEKADGGHHRGVLCGKTLDHQTLGIEGRQSSRQQDVRRTAIRIITYHLA